MSDIFQGVGLLQYQNQRGQVRTQLIVQRFWWNELGWLKNNFKVLSAEQEVFKTGWGLTQGERTRLKFAHRNPDGSLACTVDDTKRLSFTSTTTVDKHAILRGRARILDTKGVDAHQGKYFFKVWEFELFKGETSGDLILKRTHIGDYYGWHNLPKFEEVQTSTEGFGERFVVVTNVGKVETLAFHLETTLADSIISDKQNVAIQLKDKKQDDSVDAAIAALPFTSQPPARP